MILEEVRPHPSRDDIYINQIVTPFNEITFGEKNMVNHLLLKEVARNEIKAIV